MHFIVLYLYYNIIIKQDNAFKNKLLNNINNYYMYISFGNLRIDLNYMYH